MQPHVGVVGDGQAEQFGNLGSSDIITLMNLDGTVRYISPAFERILGRAPEDVIGTKVGMGPHTDDAVAVRNAFAAAVAGAPAQVMFRSRRADGTWAWLEAHAHPLRDPSTGVITIYANWSSSYVGYVSLHLDLTDVTLVGFSMGGGEVLRYLTTYGSSRVFSRRAM